MNKQKRGEKRNIELSAVVLVKNEEGNVGECLKGLTFTDEIIVIDDNSIDKTAKIASKMGARVFSRTLGGDFACQRNFALGKARGSWVLFVDADERVSAQLAKEVRQKIGSGCCDGYFLRRQDYLFGRLLRFGETANVRFLRLAKKNAGQWSRRVHETWEISGRTGELSEPLQHFPHSSVSGFIRSINQYSTLHAQALKEAGRKPSLAKIIFYPAAKFLHNYLYRQGWRDGMPGMIMAVTMSFHSFLAQSKLYLLTRGEKSAISKQHASSQAS